MPKFGGGFSFMVLKAMITNPFPKKTPHRFTTTKIQVFGWILNQKRPRNCMLPTASCTPATLLWYHPQAAPNKKTKTGDHQSEPEGKIWRWVRRVWWLLLLLLLFSSLFFFWVRGQPLTHTFLTKWREQSAGEGIWLLQWFGEKKRFPKNGWVLLCLIVVIVVISPIFFGGESHA